MMRKTMMIRMKMMMSRRTSRVRKNKWKEMAVRKKKRVEKRGIVHVVV